MSGDEAATFRALLRQHRLVAGLTQEALAERAGLSLRGVSDLERGVRRAPYPDTVRRLAAALDLSGADTSRLVLANRRVGQMTPVSPAPAPHPPALPVPMTSFVGRE